MMTSSIEVLNFAASKTASGNMETGYLHYEDVGEYAFNACIVDCI